MHGDRNVTHRYQQRDLAATFDEALDHRTAQRRCSASLLPIKLYIPQQPGLLNLVPRAPRREFCHEQRVAGDFVATALCGRGNQTTTSLAQRARKSPPDLQPAGPVGTLDHRPSGLNGVLLDHFRLDSLLVGLECAGASGVAIRSAYGIRVLAVYFERYSDSLDAVDHARPKHSRPALRTSCSA